MKISIGIEGTYAPQSAKDTLRHTKHHDYWKADLNSVRALGLDEVRYPIPWHVIERDEGYYDWDATEQIVRYAHEELGLH
jgi:beta-galactosidase GanA